MELLQLLNSLSEQTSINDPEVHRSYCADEHSAISVTLSLSLSLSLSGAASSLLSIRLPSLLIPSLIHTNHSCIQHVSPHVSGEQSFGLLGQTKRQTYLWAIL